MNQRDSTGFADSLREAQHRPERARAEAHGGGRRRETEADAQIERCEPSGIDASEISSPDVSTTNDVDEQPDSDAPVAEHVAAAEAHPAEPVDSHPAQPPAEQATNFVQSNVNPAAIAHAQAATSMPALAEVSAVQTSVGMAADPLEMSNTKSTRGGHAETQASPVIPGTFQQAAPKPLSQQAAGMPDASVATDSVTKSNSNNHASATTSIAHAPGQSPGDPPTPPNMNSPSSDVEATEERSAATLQPPSAMKSKAQSARFAVTDTQSQTSDPATTPATARVAVVEQAVRAENATGQIAQMQIETGAKSDGSPISVAGHTATGSGAQFTTRGEQSLNSLLNHVNPETDVPTFASQTIRGLTAMLNQRGGAMTLRLDPPELGALRVQMTIVGGNVSAEFTAGSQQTQALLDRHMGTLRQSLESQGLNVERLTVHAAASPSGSQQSSMRNEDGGTNTQQHGQQWSNQHNAAGGESRGRRDDAQPRQHMQRAIDSNARSFASLMDEGVMASVLAGAAP